MKKRTPEQLKKHAVGMRAWMAKPGNRERHAEQRRKARLKDIVRERERGRLYKKEWMKIPANKAAAYGRIRKRYGTVDGRAYFLWKSAQARAKQHGLPFSLTREWVLKKLEPGVCSLTGEKFVLRGLKEGRGLKFGKTQRYQMSPSIDRINNALGYTSRNCRIVTWKVNRILGPFGLKELIRVVDLMKRNLSAGI